MNMAKISIFDSSNEMHDRHILVADSVPPIFGLTVVFFFHIQFSMLPSPNSNCTLASLLSHRSRESVSRFSWCDQSIRIS